MIRAAGTLHDGRPFILIGLSAENCRRLLAGRPAIFDGAPFGYPGEIMIIGGETEDTMYDDLRRHGILDDGTAIIGDTIIGGEVL